MCWVSCIEFRGTRANVSRLIEGVHWSADSLASHELLDNIPFLILANKCDLAVGGPLVDGVFVCW
jgi:hypothetical protein